MYRNKIIPENFFSRSKLLMSYDLSTTKEENIIKIFEQEYADVIGTERYSDEQEKERQKQENLKKDFFSKFKIYNVPTPNSQSVKTITLPIESKVSFWVGNEDLQKIFFKKWEGTQWSSYIPSEKQLPKPQPQTLRSFTTPDNRSFRLSLKQNDENIWNFNWYTDEDQNPYIQSKYIDVKIPQSLIQKDETWWDKWAGITLTTLSIIAAATIPGAQGLLLSAAIDMVLVADAVVKKDIPGAVVQTLLAFAPFLSMSIKGLGRFSAEEVRSISLKFARAETDAEVRAIYRSLPDDQKILVQSVFSQEPKQLLKSIDQNIWKLFEEKLKRNVWNAKDVVDALNKNIIGKFPMPEIAKWWQKHPNLTRFGIDLGASGFILTTTYPWIKKEEERKRQQKYKNLQLQQVEPYTPNQKDIDDEKSKFWQEEDMNQN